MTTTTSPAASPTAAPAASGAAGPAGQRGTGLVLAIGGAVGLVAAFVLTVERFRLAEDPAYVPSCSIDPVLSCGSVMTTPQAALLGFPNPLVGIVAFAVATTLGVLVLAGAPLPRGVWLGLQAGLSAGLALVAWLVAQSLYVIGALCPYCVVVWAVVVPMFWVVTTENAARGVLPLPGAARRAAVVLRDYAALLTAATYAVVAAAVGTAFWDHWRSLLLG